MSGNSGSERLYPATHSDLALIVSLASSGKGKELSHEASVITFLVLVCVLCLEWRQVPWQRGTFSPVLGVTTGVTTAFLQLTFT